MAPVVSPSPHVGEGKLRRQCLQGPAWRQNSLWCILCRNPPALGVRTNAGLSVHMTLPELGRSS